MDFRGRRQFHLAVPAALGDLLGLYDGKSPRFVKRYAELATTIQDALERYAADVRSGAFPEDEHTYSIPDEELAAFLSGSTAE